MNRIILVALMLAALSVDAASWYVRTNGNDTTGNGSTSTPYLTITKVLTVASAGDTIYVGQGTNDEGAAGLNFSKSTWTTQTTIESENGNPTNTIIAATGSTYGVLINAGGNLTFKNLTFDTLSDNRTVIYPYKCTNVYFTNCIFHSPRIQSGKTLMNFQGATAISDVKFTNCVFVIDSTNNADNCLLSKSVGNAIPSTNLTFVGCTFSGPNYGLDTSNHVGLLISNCTFRTYRDCIIASQLTNFTIVNNTFSNSTAHGVCIGQESDSRGPSNGLLKDNVIACGNGHALLLGQGATGVLCYSNTVYGGDYGIVVKSATNCIVSNCVAYAGTLSAAYSKGGMSNLWVNNILYDNATSGTANAVFRTGVNGSEKVSYISFTGNTLYNRHANTVMFYWGPSTDDAGGCMSDYNSYWFTNTMAFGRVVNTTGITTLIGLQNGWEGYKGSGGYDIHSQVINPAPAAWSRSWVDRNFVTR